MSNPPPEDPQLLVRPIGFIRTAMRTKFDSPHQPKQGAEERNIIQLTPGLDLQTAVRDLAGFDRIWLIWWFHRNSTWKPLVLPPRGGAHRRGVLATRSPHRPNPIGITSVPLIEIDKLNIVVGNTDNGYRGQVNGNRGIGCCARVCTRESEFIKTAVVGVTAHIGNSTPEMK